MVPAKTGEQKMTNNTQTVESMLNEQVAGWVEVVESLKADTQRDPKVKAKLLAFAEKTLAECQKQVGAVQLVAETPARFGVRFVNIDGVRIIERFPSIDEALVVAKRHGFEAAVDLYHRGSEVAVATVASWSPLYGTKRFDVRGAK
jgi:hypothetical protein